MTTVRETVTETLGRVAENATADREIVNNSHRTTTPISLPPHLANLGIDTNAAAVARAKNDQAERDRNTTPAFRKP
jgi:hypothetical protein